jgi:phenylalanyl-tRNA synthetase beta chain
MPIVSVSRDALFESIGNNFGSTPNVPSKEADKQFDELCFRYGIELDDVTSEQKMVQKETGKTTDSASSEIIYKIDVPANRYDILCLEGLARALRIFLQTEKTPFYTLVPNKQPQRIIISKENPPHLRPYVVCAVLRDIRFDSRNYKSFIDLQEKLHQNICRKRTLVSIGTHDLDTLNGPFLYEALPPTDIIFAPLNNETIFNGVELMKHLEHEDHLKKYLPIIRDSPIYPVIHDSKRVVLSLPPIINGNHSKITLNTKNVFIEVTATDLTKAEIVLNIMCTMFTEYCAKPFTIEPVEVVSLDDKVTLYPNISSREMETSIDYILGGIGVNLSPDEIASILSRMSLSAKIMKDKKSINVIIPCTRSDILHACDIMEDVAIAYGYNNLVRQEPKTLTYGKQQNLNKVTDLLRGEVAMAGFTEALTLSLCSREENFKFLNHTDDGSAVSIANPQTLEFQVIRTSLLVGILKTISHNRKAPLPMKVFEISDVVVKSTEKDVGAINKRYLCALYCGHTSGFEIIHGLLDTVMIALGAKWKGTGEGSPLAKLYELKLSEDPTFFPGRRATIFVNDINVGVIGTIHPQVLEHYSIPFPCAALELFIEPFI